MSVNNSAMRATIIILLLACMVTPVAASVYYTSSAHQIITKGDTFSVSSTSAKNGTVAIWIIGRNYFDTLSVTPDRNGNFSVSLKPTTTEKFSSGQYAVVIQDPGPNGRMEIEPGTDSNGNLTIMNRGKIIEKIGARQDLKGNVQPVVAVLMDAANLQGVDDSFLPEYFFVEEPSVQFDQMISVSKSQLSNQITGERLVISGTTNMGPENYLRTHIYNRDTNGLVISNTIPITEGSPDKPLVLSDRGSRSATRELLPYRRVDEIEYYQYRNSKLCCGKPRHPYTTPSGKPWDRKSRAT